MEQPTAQEEAVTATTSGMFAARATRQWVINTFTVLAIAAVAYANWPTPGRTLEKRATAFVSAINRGDFDDATSYLTPAAKESWRPPAAGKRMAHREFGSLQIDEAGLTASVVLLDAKSRTPLPTNWIRTDKGWFCDCAAGKP